MGYFDAIDKDRAMESRQRTREQPDNEHSTRESGQPFSIVDKDIFPMTFDSDAKKDLERLGHEMGGRTNQEVVHTAIELLAYAMYYDLEVDSKFHSGSKRISGLWS